MKPVDCNGPQAAVEVAIDRRSSSSSGILGRPSSKRSNGLRRVYLRRSSF